MTGLILPNRFAQQPQYAAPVDNGGIGKNLRFALIGGSAKGVVNGIDPSQLLTTEVVRDGVAYILPFSGAAWSRQVSGLDPAVGDSFTIYWRGVINIQDETSQYILNYKGGYGWTCSFECWFPSNFRIHLSPFWQGSSGTEALSGTASATNGSSHSVAVRYDKVTGLVDFFLDGVVFSTSSNFQPDPNPITSGIFETKSQWGNQYSAHKAVTLQAYNGALSDGQIASLHGSPWQAFKAPPRRLWVVSASSGITLVGANSTEANTSSTGAITQAHTLTGSNSTQANTSLSAAVTQTQALAGANSTQANTTSTGAISQTHVLAGANSSETNASSASAITQTHVLAVANCSQGNAASTGSIAGGANLTAASCAQANAASTGSVSQAHVLTAANSAQANTASTGAISQGAVNDLTAASATQANSGGTGAITQAHVLVHAPSVQDNIAAASAIVQAHVLAAANCSQGNVASSAALISDSVSARRTYSVPVENRAYLVPAESRTYTVPL